MPEMIKINHRLFIPERELQFKSTPSSGPGGQHVNKVSSRIILSFDVLSSPSLSENDLELILNKLKNRINKEGVLQIVSQGERSQHANKKRAVERFVELLQGALKKQAHRKATKIPFAAKKRRLDHKKKHSRLKQLRSKNFPTE